MSYDGRKRVIFIVLIMDGGDFSEVVGGEGHRNSLVIIVLRTTGFTHPLVPCSWATPQRGSPSTLRPAILQVQRWSVSMVLA